MSLPRSVRNNNPGNMRVGPPWRGLMPRSQMNADQRAETAFCVYVSPEYGFRGMKKQLEADHFTHGCRSVRDYITSWAPECENDTEAYIQFVAHHCGVGADDPQDIAAPDFLKHMAKAIATKETGGWDGFWTDEQLEKGFALG